MTTVETPTTALFPLGQPLFPGTTMKLRIFEQRYLKLVRDSMSSGEPFAIVPILRGREVGRVPEFSPWGTLATIVDFDQGSDGVLGIAIQGGQRCHVLYHDVQADGLVVANVERLAPEAEDEPGVGDSDLVTLLEELVEGLDVADAFPPEALTLGSLSWRLAALLPLPGAVKVSLLKEGDPAIRLDIIRECLVELTRAERPLN